MCLRQLQKEATEDPDKALQEQLEEEEEKESKRGRGCGKGKGRGRGRGQTKGRGRGRGNSQKSSKRKQGCDEEEFEEPPAGSHGTSEHDPSAASGHVRAMSAGGEPEAALPEERPKKKRRLHRKKSKLGKIRHLADAGPGLEQKKSKRVSKRRKKGSKVPKHGKAEASATHGAKAGATPGIVAKPNKEAGGNGKGEIELKGKATKGQKRKGETTKAAEEVKAKAEGALKDLFVLTAILVWSLYIYYIILYICLIYSNIYIDIHE